MKVLSHMVNYPDSSRHQSTSTQQQQTVATRPLDEFRIAPSLSSKHPRCFMTLKTIIGIENSGDLIVDNGPQPATQIPEQTVQVVFELFSDVLPKTCENFMQLCKGTTDAHGRKLHYKNSQIYEIIPDWCVVGGDFVNNNGTGGMSIYGNGNGSGNGYGNGNGNPRTVKNRRISCQNDSNGTEFEDESFAADYSQPGLLCMLSHGPHTNTSIFFVTMKPAEWIKGLYVAFGRVASGLDQLHALAEKLGTQSGLPKKSVIVADCGLL